MNAMYIHMEASTITQIMEQHSCYFRIHLHRRSFELSEIAALNHPVPPFFCINRSTTIISRCCTLWPLFFYISRLPSPFLPLSPLLGATRRMHFLGQGQLMAGLQPPNQMAFRRFTRRQLLQPRFGIRSFARNIRTISRREIMPLFRIDRPSIVVKKRDIHRHLKAARCNCRFSNG